MQQKNAGKKTSTVENISPTVVDFTRAHTSFRQCHDTTFAYWSARRCDTAARVTMRHASERQRSRITLLVSRFSLNAKKIYSKIKNNEKYPHSAVKKTSGGGGGGTAKHSPPTTWDALFDIFTSKRAWHRTLSPSAFRYHFWGAHFWRSLLTGIHLSIPGRSFSEVKLCGKRKPDRRTCETCEPHTTVCGSVF